MFASWFWGEYFNTDSFNDADNPRLLAVKKRPGSAHVPPDYPPKKHTAAPPGHLPKNDSSTQIRPRKDLTQRKMKPRKNAQKWSPKKQTCFRKNTPEKTNTSSEKTKMCSPKKRHAFPKKHAPGQKVRFPDQNVFSERFSGWPEKTNNVFSERRPFFRVTRKNTKNIFSEFFRVARKNTKTTQNIFSDSFRGVFGGPIWRSGKWFSDVFSGTHVCFFGRVFVFSGRGLVFSGPRASSGRRHFGCRAFWADAFSAPCRPGGC